MDMETLREIISRPVCLPCLDAMVASAKESGEDYQDAERVYKWAYHFGDQISPGDHECAEEDDEDVDCWCGCQVSGGGGSFNEFTTQGSVCESCIEAVQDCTMALGLASDGIMHTYMYARTMGGDHLPDHWCEAEDDAELECHCGCAAVTTVVPKVCCDSCGDAVEPGDIVVRSLCQECAEENNPRRKPRRRQIF